MDIPGGYELPDARSTRAGDTVAVAQMAVQRIVVPPVVGSNPIGHLAHSLMVEQWSPTPFTRVRFLLRLLYPYSSTDRISDF